MTHDDAKPALFRAVKGSRKEAIQSVACALVARPKGALSVATVRVAWSERLAARLRGIARQALESGLPEGRLLPYASLRAALQVQLPRAVVLARKLGEPWRQEERPAFLHVEDDGSDPRSLAGAAVRTWMALVLRPWAERVGVDEALLDAAAELATAETAFAVDRQELDLGQALRDGEPFERVKHAVLQMVSRRLEGQELFEGLGPVYRAVRAAAGSNAVHFQTWPIAAPSGGQYSMVATIAVESAPWLGAPYLTVRASRRRWLDDVPDPGKLRRQRRITASMMSRQGARVAVEVAAAVRDGVPEDPGGPEFMIHALNVRADVAAPLAEMVARHGASGVFVGIPYSPALGGSHQVGAGATTRDQLDLFDAVRGLLADAGFEPLPFQETSESRTRNVKRAEEFHKALEAEALAADIALTLGRNDLDGDALLEACRTLMVDGELPSISPDSALGARAKLERLRAANQERIRRAFGDATPTVVVLARTEQERSVMRAIIGGLFGCAVAVTAHQLPARTHGPRSSLPEAPAKAKARFAARVAEWAPLTNLIAAEHRGCHVLVQAAEWYDRRKDDVVNKLAGRHALASRADANVQYLRPPEKGWRGLGNYLNRIQAAVYDLMFGHSGLVSEIGSLLRSEFPDDAARPRAIIGISVVTQSRLRYGGAGGRICLATRIDAETGRTTARVGWFDRVMKWTGWEPFFVVLKRIANPEMSATLGDGDSVERDSFQKFVKAVIDDAAVAGDRPLVIVDSTSAAGLWPWLTDAGIGRRILLGAERVDMASCWPGVRLVRVRRGHAGRILERKRARYERVGFDAGEATGEFADRYCPTVAAQTVRIANEAGGPGTHYWVTSGYFQMSLPRGLSVYRKLTSFVPVAKVREIRLPDGVAAKGLFAELPFDLAKATYRLPNAIDVTVAAAFEGDDPDRIAQLVASLRYGYGHTAATTALPAPLSFESKVRDYMTRFGLEEADTADAPFAEDGDETDAATTPGKEVESTRLAPEIELDEDQPDAPEEARDDPMGTDATPVATGRASVGWEDFVRNFATGLVGTSMLTRHRVELALPILEDGHSPSTLSMSLASEKGAAEGVSAMSESRCQAGRWDSFSREPVLPVPPFVTHQWLAPKVAVNFGLLKEMHNGREEIRCLSGYPSWPERQPSAEQFVDLLIDGFRYPCFVRAVTRVAARHVPSKTKREKFHLFKPFSKASKPAVIEAARALGRQEQELDAKEMRQLADGGHLDVALGRMFLITLGLGASADYLAVAHERRAQFGSMIPFLEAAEKHLARGGEFDWQRDVVGSPRAAPAVSQDVQKDGHDGARPRALRADELTTTSRGSAARAEGSLQPMVLDRPGGAKQAGDKTADAGHDRPRAVPITPTPDRPSAATRVPAESAAASPATGLTGQAGGADASRAAWDAALAQAVRVANAAIGGDPDPGVLSQLVARLKAARAAQKAWETSRPVMVDAAPLADEMRRLAATLAELAEQDPVDVVQRTGMVAAAAAEAARAALDEGRMISDEAAALRSEATALMAGGDLRNVEAVMALKTRLRARTADGLDALRRASASLAEHARAVPLSSATLVEPERTRGPTPPAAEEDEPPATVVADEDDAALELVAELAAEPEEPAGVEAAGKTQLGAPSEPSASDDPFAAEVERKLSLLFCHHEFGLAYHLLRAARRVFPDRRFPFAEAELRLAAMSGHNNHAAMQGSELLASLLREALGDADALRPGADHASSEDVAVARRIVLHAVSCPLALFHTASPAVQILQALDGVAPGLADGLRAVTDAVAEAAHSGLPVTLAALRSAGQEAEAETSRYGDECRAALLAKIRFISELRFAFQLGNKVRAVLARSDGAVGALKLAIERDGTVAVEAARAFTSRHSDRGGIIALLDAAEAQVNSRIKGIDGSARERLVANVLELATLCDEFVQARDAVPAVRNSSYRTKLLGIRDAVCSGVDRAVRALGSFAEESNPVPAAASAFAAAALGRLKAAAQGERSLPAAIDHVLAVHGPLLWLPGLQFGRSWLPSPYQPERVVETILRASEPVVPPDDERVRAFEGAIRARKEEGSFVAARILAEIGAFFGVPEALRATLLESIDGDVPARRGALERGIEDVRRRVDRMERMGHLASHDDAQRLASLLGGIDPAKLPADIALDYRSEDEDSGQVLDFCSADSLLEDVRAQADALLERPRREILADLDRMSKTGKVSDHDIDRIRGLVVQQDDLLTAREWMDFLESGRSLPETASPNPRFQTFFPNVPDALARMTKGEIAAASRRIREGRDLGPLAFFRIPEPRREDAVELFESWAELRRRVQGGATVDNIPSFLTRLLDRAGLSAELTRSDVGRSNARRKVYVVEMQLRIPEDADSVLLPDFGSLTGGNYRVCAVAKPPSPSEVSALCDGAGSLGIIVLVMDVVDVEQRRNLTTVLVEQNRRVLVIDEAIFLFALSEPEFRPLTLIECAQPFSFAAPYRDYGNAAVPPEMFFGREAEQRKIYEPLGSCVVYGGRRLGKTALLRHVQATRHDPANGVLVAYVNIFDIGNNALPSMVWEYASRELVAVFPNAVRSADAFAAEVRQWLDGDTKRRVLVLFDESDRFIEEDARDGFREFIRLQTLMDGTGRRFKMVLAGLHNVTRLVHTENPPLKQIAADPLRIGALMDDEMKDAELLVTRPLAAMGYEFENRGDAWRILSHCNYYPVLVQTFCEKLVDDLHKEVVRRRRPVRTITGEHVRRALESEQVVKLIGEKFDYTISKIDPRYELIACIMADRALVDDEAGRVDEGISAVEVRDRAIEHWPAAFDKVNRLSIIEDLLPGIGGR